MPENDTMDRAGKDACFRRDRFGGSGGDDNADGGGGYAAPRAGAD